jgi:hypothetical protein
MPPTSLVGSGETGYRPTDRSADVLWIVSGALFLGCSGICSNLSASHEGLQYVDYVIYCHTRFLRPKPDAHRMYAQDKVVIHTVRM